MQDWKTVFLADFEAFMHPQVLDRLDFSRPIDANMKRLKKEAIELKKRAPQCVSLTDEDNLRLAINETFSLLTGLVLTQNKLSGEKTCTKA